MPVTITWTTPVEENVHDRVELPDPATFDGVNEQDVLFEFRLTVPLKPCRAVMLIVETPDWLTGTETLGGAAEIAKS